MKKQLVFTATYNEADNIAELINSIFNALPDCEILVVDDHSPDGTGKILNFLAGKNPKIHLIHRTRKLGLGSAHKLAVKYALKNNFDALITMDADFSHNPKYLPKIVELLEKNDFVIASRFAQGGQCDYGIFRLALSRAANLAARVLLNIPLKETTTSFRGFSRNLLKTCNIDTIHSEGYSYFFEFVAYVCRKTRKIAEFPIHFEDRRAGSTKISKKEILNGILTLIRLALSRLFGRNQAASNTVEVAINSREWVPCNVCGSEFHTEEYPASTTKDQSTQYTCTSTHHSSHGRIVRCLGCGLVYTNPQIPAEDLLSIYAQTQDQTYLENMDARVDTFKYNFEKVMGFLPKEGKLLDIGSYCGVFLKVAQEKGYEVLGVEPSLWASQHANQVLKVPTINGNIKTLANENRRFDVACAWDVLEHFTNPMEELRLINEVLQPGGIFCFSTLNFENWFPKMMGERWPWMMDMHLYYFTTTVIEDMLAKTGFRLKHAEAYCHIITADYFLLKLHSLGMPGAKLIRTLMAGTWLSKRCIPFHFGDIQLYVCEKVCEATLKGKQSKHDSSSSRFETGTQVPCPSPDISYPDPVPSGVFRELPIRGL